ncbi:hypothetical protein [Hymenobacter fodinae]|uniref:Mannose-6-phosphate isomerase-like protein (Cupin superfamily) n=1 Tax=Hymenobacter fodinae TaxID=2510796 RepID=A0A4Z0P383_9BACT|nr:hypothetical protein [Hymenobacter fodinae]TGE05579.1 hypothetical protein EU556_19965 [Hymenobacter fodinae]
MNSHTPVVEELEQLLSTHGEVLQALLQPLWPINPFKVEQFGPLTKYTLGQMPDGRWAMLHRLTEADTGSPHDHPTRMDSHVLKGAYWEIIYHEDGRTERVLRAAGGYHTIWPHTVHRIVELPEGECWTLVLAGPVVREWRHYPELVG